VADGGFTHGGEVDDAGNADEVLHDHYLHFCTLLGNVDFGRPAPPSFAPAFRLVDAVYSTRVVVLLHALLLSSAGNVLCMSVE
jgi:hypothetical protein